MIANEKFTKGAPRNAPDERTIPETPINHFAMLLHRNTARLFAWQKTTLEMASECMQEMAEFGQHTTDRIVSAQKWMLDFAAEQNKTAAESIRRQPGLKGSAIVEMTESVERGFDALIGMQKDFLDRAQSMTKTATAGTAV